MLALGKLLDLTLADHEPAAKIQLTAEGARLRWLAAGVLEISPPAGCDSGLDLLLSAGLHGNETAPIELLDRLLQAIARGHLKPQARVLFVFGNPEAMRRGERFIEQDLNALFSGEHERHSGPEALRAGDLEQLARTFFKQAQRRRLHYDLHTTIRPSLIEPFALYPLPEGQAGSRAELAQLRAAGISAVLLYNKSSATFSAYTAQQLQAQAFTLKLGTARPFGQNQHIDLSALEQQIAALIAGSPTHANELGDLQLFSLSREVIKHSEGFRLHLPTGVANFTELGHGSLLAEDLSDTRWLVSEPHSRILFANPRVPVGARAGLVIVPAHNLQLV
ncbi:succinylglutamate desuccinylase [Pseudomonas sp. 5P_3.1_Bac2]|uniref:succinylglutamate desuccinylase n=1 Tax=Pseudomonas sp. 5P_3.1_Bac2 TaxID=2971617 RepID=UPI0021C5F2AD|nr:succinylglutamate desuccinylase [Pseudomonas sp. 5P_3.1_Bac2]MCU1715868.1 succinylglutamate desuccinylase [Pseudomonas sp. 5P_3.1_Bac2]